MNKKVTKKLILEGGKITFKYGYWSEEVRDFLDTFTTSARNKIETILNSTYNSNQQKASEYYNFFLENGLISGAKQDRIISSLAQQKTDEKWIMQEAERVNLILKKCTIETYIDMMNK